MTVTTAAGPDAGAHRGDRQGGITFIEIVVALVVIALALGIAVAAMRLLVHSGERGARLIARHDILSRGIDVLRHDIERIERATWKRGDAREVIFHGDAGRLIFLAVEPPFPAEAGPYFIAYAIRQGRDGATLTRERAPFQSSVVDLQQVRTEDSVAVIEGPYRMRFLYLARNDAEGRWLAQWSDPADLPGLVALEISNLAGGAATPLLVFRPAVDAERTCVRDNGSCNAAGSDAPTGRGGGN